MAGLTGAFVTKDGSNLGVTPHGARVALGGLIAHDGTGALAARPGVFYDGLGAVVTGTATTGTMTYSVRACVFALYLTGLASGGIVYVANDAASLPTTGAATNRTDRIWVRQHHVSTDDGGTDTDTIVEFGVAQGVAIPTGATEIANAAMTSGTTHTSTVTITQSHNWVVAAGAQIPVRTSTERDVMTDYTGMSVYRLDNQNIEISDGTAFRPLPFAHSEGTVNVSAAALAAGGATAFAVTFPAGRFTQAPLVQCCLQAGPGGSANATVRANSITTSGFSLLVYNTGSSAMTFASTACAWSATQMLSGAAAG